MLTAQRRLGPWFVITCGSWIPSICGLHLMQLDRCKPYERRHGELEPWVIQGHHPWPGLTHGSQ